MAVWTEDFTAAIFGPGTVGYFYAIHCGDPVIIRETKESLNLSRGFSLDDYLSFGLPAKAKYSTVREPRFLLTLLNG